VQVGGAVQKPRAGEPGPIAVERVECPLLNPLVAGQAEVVVRAEHDPLPALHLDDRQRRALEHPEIGHQILLARGSQLLEPVVLARLREHVD